MRIRNFATSPERFARAAGMFGLISCMAVVVANIAGLMIYEAHDPISETISALAAGRYGWIQDTGLVLFAIGWVGGAAALYRWSLGGSRWTAAVALMLALGVDLILIALYNEYGDTDAKGAVIHMYCTYALAVLFALIPWLLSTGLGRLSRRWARLGAGTSIAWVVLAPLYLGVPTSWNGAYERFLGMIIVAWLAGTSWLLVHRARSDRC